VFNLFLQHDVRLLKGQRVNVNVNVSNLFDQKAITNFNQSPWLDTFNGFPFVPTTDAAGGDRYFFNGFDPYALAAAMRAAGATQRDNPLYKLPGSGNFQSRRSIRLGLKWTF